MHNPTSFIAIFFLLFILNSPLEILAQANRANAKLYIVYLGHKPHNDHDLITDSHHDLLSRVAGSKEEAKKLIVYSYRHGFSGFAAKLTDFQAKQIAELPGVLRVIRNHLYEIHTTRSWEFLGLFSHDPNNLLNITNQGDGMIIGLIDSGIWGESEAFNDNGIGPIPPRWKGGCKSDGKFDAAKHCNKKVIGARWYVEGLIAEQGLNRSEVAEDMELSPMDDHGHGTHAAYTAGGSYVYNMEYYGLQMGTLRGGAPNARLAIYKACWFGMSVQGCAGADVLAAFDDAIKDGVDVLSLSLGQSHSALLAEVHAENFVGIGSFHAVSHGIPVVCAAGNAGPTSQTIVNTSPWIITVAASSMDRELVTPLTLGNNKTILGQGFYKGKPRDFAPLFFGGIAADRQDLKEIADQVKGKIVMLFSPNVEVNPYGILKALYRAECAGLIYAMPTSDTLSVPHEDDEKGDLPFIAVDFEQGNQILDYVHHCISINQAPLVKLGQSKVLQGKPLSPKVARFSSRGGNSFAPEIIKPDIAAPGVRVLAAVPPSSSQAYNGYRLMSGTSMAAPHVSGIVALLRVAHPEWSPAAIRSALVTTAWNEDTYASQIFSEGTGEKLADPFDFGGGISNPNGAMDPGLVYDMNKDDYLNYFCSLGYSNGHVYNATRSVSDAYNVTAAGIVCPMILPSKLDLNLPSIAIPNLKTTVTVKRTVTNVGDVNSMYKLVVKPPRNTVVSVVPDVLKFNPNIKQISFVVQITSTHQENTKFNFGSLAWSDGKHFVRSPIAVRKQMDA